MYVPHDVERELYARWQAADVFAPDGEGSRADRAREPFVIIQPPPNVTGALHLGHALTSALEDAMVRRARMQGRPALWLPGKDHASIAAQFVLDRVIAAEGESRASLGRERYLERMWSFVRDVQGVISDQHRRLGVTADWRRERFTMDEVSARAVRTAFARLHRDGLAYRSEALVNWCPKCLTSISDLEVIAKPEKGHLWTIRYHLLDDDGRLDPDAWVPVATTRPETLLGDTAVAVHPEDNRYRHLVGRRVMIPFVERAVAIIADDVVERSFGTGAVKITPAHDPDDYATGKRHGLAFVNVMTDDGRMNDAAGPYAGLDRYACRKRILADLEARGDLAATMAHEMVIGHCQRSDDIVEPRLKTQWFIRTQPMAEKALAAVREGRTRILPARFEKVYFDWLENIHDWNVSRQIWWGHRIPAWYCRDGHVTVTDRIDGPDACETCRRPAAELTQESDIFDTWFSSGLWPFSTLGWPEQTDDLRRFYPGSVMETGYDIIFFWVARMMMLGEWLMGEEPFGTVYLHGMVRDPYGQKMSKTKGNVVDPLEVIDDMGADSLRFALINGTSPGNDQRLDRAKLEGARNFGNKIWNAARFVLGARPDEIAAGASLVLPPAERLGPAERWILARCADTCRDADAAFETFQFGEATRLVHEATWSEYCDWYLELAKVRLSDPAAEPADRVATWQVLAWVLDRYVRLLHPVMPFITEAIWQELPHRPGDPALLIVADWPTGAEERALVPDSAAAEAPVDALLAAIRGIRNARAEAGIEASAWLEADLAIAPGPVTDAYRELEAAFSRLARVRIASVARVPEDLPAGVDGGLVVIAGEVEARLRRAGADLARERARLERELDEARVLLNAAEARLGNESFVARAPAHVVEGSRRSAAELRDRVAVLTERLAGD
jgi:valyl-tRNA synthetase